MTHTMNGHATPRRLLEDERQLTRDADRGLLDLQADVLSLVDEDLPLTRSVDRGGDVRPTFRRDDRLGARLRRSVMFADARES